MQNLLRAIGKLKLQLATYKATEMIGVGMTAMAMATRKINRKILEGERERRESMGRSRQYEKNYRVRDRSDGVDL